MKKVLIFDTSVLCVWLRLKGFESCGPDGNRWDFERISEKVNSEEVKGTTFVLPLASIIETGNHIAHLRGDKRNAAVALQDLIIKTADAKSPWAAFERMNELMSAEGLNSWFQNGWTL